MTISARLKALMRVRGIRSQNQLARIAGVSQSSIHRILVHGEDYNAERRTLRKLAKALDSSVPWLAEGVETIQPWRGLAAPSPRPAAPALPETDGETDGYLAEATTILGRMTSDERKKIVAVLRLLDHRPPR